jgi:hypothetical protein
VRAAEGLPELLVQKLWRALEEAAAELLSEPEEKPEPEEPALAELEMLALPLRVMPLREGTELGDL